MRRKASLVVLLVLVQASLQFQLPSIEEVFGNLLGKTDTRPAEPVKVKSREKRQNPGIGDESQLPHEVRTSKLPPLPGGTDADINTRYMPVVGNGYIASTVYSGEMFVNGLYNGKGGDSHRAMVPAVVMTRVSLDNPQLESLTKRTYSFNVETGVFMEIIDCPFAYVEHRTYVHQKYIRLLVTDIYARRKDGQYNGLLYLKYKDLNESQDITFEAPLDYFGNRQVKGKTKVAEDGAATQNVNVFYYQRVSDISMTSGKTEANETMVMSLDVLESAAKADFDQARAILSDTTTSGAYRLLQEHIDAWKKTWNEGKVEVTGDTQLAKVVMFSQYYLLSSLPPLFANQPPQYDQVYYGYTRTSLGKGSSGRDYQGHMFWDSEMYVFPPMLLFHPRIAKYMLRYRSAKLNQAQENAKKYGQEGARFPWESAFSGSEVTPDACIKCREQQIFTSGAVGWAIRNYYSATRDRDYMTNTDYNGCDMTREIAKFYATIAKYNSTKGRYDINGVMGPDDWHSDTNNNAFVNVMASLAIHYARYFACLCNRNERAEVPDEWVQTALYLDLPFDNVKRLHYQYDGYDKNTNRTIKQADTILLTFPVAWNMSVDIMRNDLYFYEQYMDHRTPAMTHSFMTVGWKWVKEDTKMLNSFIQSYQDYMIQPFKVWTEYNERSWQDQQVGSVNYLPGMGAFMQSVIYGFGGVRIRPEALEFHNPMPPPNCNTMKFTHFDYLGAVMDITIEINKVSILVKSIAEYTLTLKRNQTNAMDEQLTAGSFVEIENAKDGFYIYPNTQSSCEHPRDYIFMPWGYSPWISAAPSCSSSLLTFISVFILLWFR